MRDLARSFCILHFALCIGACSVPSLESPECAAASEVVRQYYALAIGSDVANDPSTERIRSLRSAEFTAGAYDGRADRDGFHFSAKAPTSFRVGNCRNLQDGRAVVDVTVIWRLENQNFQRADSVTASAQDGHWLIDRIDVGEQPGTDF